MNHSQVVSCFKMLLPIGLSNAILDLRLLNITLFLYICNRNRRYFVVNHIKYGSTESNIFADLEWSLVCAPWERAVV